MAELVPCTLVGRRVRLEPLTRDDAEGLVEAGKGVDWRWMFSSVTSRAEAERYIASSQASREKGDEFAFAVKLGADGRIVGSTRYMDIQPSHRGVEIGGTWYSPEFQGTVVNPECKYLLLRHAFEDWGAVRVQLKTDVRNEKSQRAILKLGARFEGKLRNHRVRPDGTLRDTMMYSITAEEWPEVRAGLVSRVGRQSEPR